MKLKIAKNDLLVAAALLLGVAVLMVGQYLILTAGGAASDAPAPAQPGLAQPGVTAPGFDVIRVTRDGRAVMAGRAAAGAEVTVSSGEKIIGKTFADRRGDWVLIPDLALPPGAQVLTLSTRLGAADAVASTDSAIISVPERPDGDVFVAVSKPGKPTRIIELGLPPVIVRGGVQVAGIDIDPQGQAILSGHAAPGQLIRVYLDDSVAGDASTAANGEWSLTYYRQVAAGAHRLRADQIDPAGKVELRAEIAFERTIEGRIDLGDQKVVVMQGNKLWEIARQVYGKGIAYSIIFTGNQDQIRDPDLIYPGQEFRLPAEDETATPAE